MPTVPAPILVWIDRQFHDLNGAPLVGGQIYSYLAGTSTPKALYTDVSLATPCANPVVLDAEGRATCYMASGGYKVVVCDADDVELYTVDNVYDPGSTLFATLGTVYTEGAKGESADYQVVAGDNLVTVDGGVVYLEPAADRSFPLFIKNIGSNPLIVTPDGTDTIDSVATYTMDAAASPEFPCVQLVSDGVSNWWIVSSHKC